ncbi:cytochrome P450 monooxygenase [Xylariales sp. PMI_506]|nr:cytochrome P450 monooxygenase [Xylariales sp. PMI_506]
MTLSSDIIGSLEDRAILPRIAVLLICSAAGYTLWSLIQNLFASPLRKIPGPILWSISPIPQALMQLSGEPHKRILALHQHYGDVVRTSPNSVSLLSPEAWNQTYGHRKFGTPENLKDPGFFSEICHSVIAADSADHSRMRRILAHGFSAQSMTAQEPLIRGYVDLLLQRCREHSDAGRPMDMVKWFNFITFDLIGDLTFGESFGCLENSTFHAWVSMIFDHFREKHTLAQLRRAYPAFESAVAPILKRFAAKLIHKQEVMTESKIAKRLALSSQRPDFMDSMMAKDAAGKTKMSRLEIRDNANVLIVAGSETTASTLCGVTFLLCKNQGALSKLCDEVRSSFENEHDITLLTVQKLDYMLAVLNESMRIYPAAAGSVPRRIHEGGENICGYYIPENSIVDIWHWAMYHNPNNFSQPESFIPERWLDDPRFANDKRHGFQPFSTGGRNCLGKNLAYAEMRLILARLVWSYDISLVDQDMGNWVDQRMYGLWEKPPLNIRLSPREFN